MPRQIPSVAVVEVHHEKSQVRGQVGDAEAAVEFDAVVDTERIGQADVLGMEIAVSLPDEAFLLPTPHEPGVPLQKTLDIGGAPAMGPCREGFADEGEGLPEILLPIPPDRFEIDGLCRPPADRGIPVELGDASPHALHFPRKRGGSGCQQAIEHAILGQTHHVDRILDGLPWAFDGDASLRTADFPNSQVGIGAKTAIESHLFPAIVGPPFQGGKVEKTEVDRFFDFIDVPFGKIKTGNMGLAKNDPIDIFRIGLGAKQGFVKGMYIHGVIRPNSGLMRNAPLVASSVCRAHCLLLRHIVFCGVSGALLPDIPDQPGKAGLSGAFEPVSLTVRDLVRL